MFETLVAATSNGAKLAESASLEEWKERPSQYEVARGDLVAKVREIVLPSALTVESEWGEIVCPAAHPCTRFETPPVRAGQSVLYWLGI